MKFQDFICGLFAGWSQIIVGQPFDYIKVKVQVQSQQAKKSMIDIAKQIRKQHGILGFYRGASSLFFGFAFTIGLEFAIYEFSKRLIHNLRAVNENEKNNYNDSSLKISDIGIAGGIVGLSVSLVYCPIQYVKIKRQIHSEVNMSSLSLLFNQIKDNGIKNLTKGLSATILRQTIGSCVYYGVYEYCVRALSKQKRDDANYFNYALSGCLSGVSYWLVAYPFDVIKTKVQNGQNYKNVLKHIISSGYRGFSVVLIRSSLVNAVSFPTYQYSKKLFEWLKNKKQIY